MVHYLIFGSFIMGVPGSYIALNTVVATEPLLIRNGVSNSPRPLPSLTLTRNVTQNALS